MEGTFLHVGRRSWCILMHFAVHLSFVARYFLITKCMYLWYQYLWFRVSVLYQPQKKVWIIESFSFEPCAFCSFRLICVRIPIILVIEKKLHMIVALETLNSPQRWVVDYEKKHRGCSHTTLRSGNSPIISEAEPLDAGEVWQVIFAHSFSGKSLGRPEEEANPVSFRKNHVQLSTQGEHPRNNHKN